MAEINGPISANDLMSKLVQAKKVMNKVDGGDYKRGNIDESMLMMDTEQVMTNESAPAVSTRTAPPPSVDRINKSKLPDAIKKAMIDHPIEQMPSISLNETLDMDFVKGAKRLMEQEGVSSKKTTQVRTQTPVVSNIDMNAIAVLIENTVRKVMDEKLNQILSAQQTQTISENLVLKVGDSVFKGKITGVNKAK
jgi:hypothetical protein